jgi:hypothetical protein
MAMDSMSRPGPRDERDQKIDKRKGIAWSILLHALLFLIALLPLMTYPVPPPGQEGVLVSFGSEETGSGEDSGELPSESLAEPNINAIESSVEPTASQSTMEQIRTSDLPEEVGILSDLPKPEAKAKVEVGKPKSAVEVKPSQVETKVNTPSEVEQYNQSKSQFGDLFGKGKGNTTDSGNQGQEEGDPTAKALAGVSSGIGLIGGGLSGRGLSYQPQIKDKSQKTGKIVVKVCVDAEGKVISAEYTQLGSTSTDLELKKIAVQSALQFKFTSSNVDRQCGTISIDFKLK